MVGKGRGWGGRTGGGRREFLTKKHIGEFHYISRCTYVQQPMRFFLWTTVNVDRIVFEVMCSIVIVWCAAAAIWCGEF